MAARQLQRLQLRTVREKYKDGTVKVFHRTQNLVFTHADTQPARLACEICAEQDELNPVQQIAVGTATADGSRARPHKLDEEATLLLAVAADPSEFDKLRRRGWPGWAASGSQLLPPCGNECHICNPTPEDNVAAHRRARKGRK